MAVDWSYCKKRARASIKAVIGVENGGGKEEGEAKGDVGSSGEAGILPGNRAEFR